MLKIIYDILEIFNFAHAHTSRKLKFKCDLNFIFRFYNLCKVTGGTIEDEKEILFIHLLILVRVLCDYKIKKLEFYVFTKKPCCQTQIVSKFSNALVPLPTNTACCKIFDCPFNQLFNTLLSNLFVASS